MKTTKQVLSALNKGMKIVHPMRSRTLIKQEDNEWCGCVLGAIAYGMGKRKEGGVYAYLADKIDYKLQRQIEDWFEYDKLSFKQIFKKLEKMI